VCLKAPSYTFVPYISYLVSLTSYLLLLTTEVYFHNGILWLIFWQPFYHTVNLYGNS